MKRWNILMITWVLTLYSCFTFESNDDKTQFRNSDIIRSIEIENQELLANGVSTTKVIVDLSQGADENLLEVSAMASLGAFEGEGGSVDWEFSDAGVKPSLELTFQSGLESGNAEIKIDINGYSRTANVELVPQEPDGLDLSVTTLSNDASPTFSIDFTVKGTCEQGTISLNQQNPNVFVTYLDEMNVTHTVGTEIFTNSLSDSSGMWAGKWYLAPDTSLTGEFLMHVEGVDELKDSIIFFLYE